MSRLNTRTWVALAVVILVYPAVRFALPYLDAGALLETRSDWWRLWTGVLIGHWLCFAICARAISSDPDRWMSVGLDWRWFVNHKYPFLIALALLVAAAVLIPAYFYGETPPPAMRSHPLGPVTAAERLFWIGIAISAGLVEEVLYRGFAITRLKRVANLPIAIIVATAAFAFMHGPSALEPSYLSIYVISALVFSGVFIWLRCRRLHWLILVHTAADMTLIVAP